MNTIATLDLLPTPRKSLTSAAQDLVRRFRVALSAKAPMVSVPAGLILVKRDSRMVHARKPGSQDVVVWPVPPNEPETIRNDVVMCVRGVDTFWNSYPVLLSACLSCGWEGHTS